MWFLPCNHCSFIVCCGAGTQIKSQPGFRRAAALTFCLCCEGTRSTLWLPGSPFKALCRQVFANRSLNSLCLKWHGLSWGSECGFDLPLAQHEKKRMASPEISHRLGYGQQLHLHLLPFVNKRVTTTRPLLAQVWRRLHCSFPSTWHIFLLQTVASECWKKKQQQNDIDDQLQIRLDNLLHRRGHFFVMRGISSLWRVTSKTCWMTTTLPLDCGKPTLRSYIAESNVILMKDGLIFFFRRRRCGRVITTTTSLIMIFHVGGAALSSWEACVLWAQIWCFGCCLCCAVQLCLFSLIRLYFDWSREAVSAACCWESVMWLREVKKNLGHWGFFFPIWFREIVQNVDSKTNRAWRKQDKATLFSKLTRQSSEFCFYVALYLYIKYAPEVGIWRSIL